MMRSGLRQARILVVRPRAVNVAGPNPLDAWPPVLDMGARDMIYGMLLVGLLGAVAYALSQRVPLGLDVIWDRKALFRERGRWIENVYHLERPKHERPAPLL